jgi:alkylated DNA repair dioxygenase AlkB
MKVRLDESFHIEIMQLPRELRCPTSEFDKFWQKHPPGFNSIHIHGKKIKIPRYQQAFGRDYAFSGSVAEASAIPDMLEPVLHWSQAEIASDLNGLLVNWYEPSLGHYIGQHRDSEKGLRPGSPIVMVSLGGDRLLRLRSSGGEGRRDIAISDGTIVVIPWETNRAWTHGVPRLKRFIRRRISVTLRCFLP